MKNKELYILNLIEQATDIQDVINTYGTNAFDNTKYYIFMTDYPEFCTLVNKYEKAVTGCDPLDARISTLCGSIIDHDDWKVLFKIIDLMVLGKAVQYDKAWATYGYHSVIGED